MFLFYRLHIIHEVLLYKNFILALHNGMMLRKILATLLLQQGIHPKIVSERLGHANISMTLDIYSHVLPNMQLEAVKKLGNIFN
ncbi:Tyrosine recombinase XerD [compost metagenome]